MFQVTVKKQFGIRKNKHLQFFSGRFFFNDYINKMFFFFIETSNILSSFVVSLILDFAFLLFCGFF